MKRRDFLKSTLLFAAVSTVLGKASGIFTEAFAAPAGFVAVGKLGYKEESPQAKNGKQCSTCKHFKADAAATKLAGKPSGQCVLPAMKTAAKTAGTPLVFEAAYCNMWAKKA